MAMAVIRTLCGQCGMGCGVRATTGDARAMWIEGDRMHPANGGRLCDRGRALPDQAMLDGRLLHPLIAGRPVSRDRAIAQVARRLSAIVARHGPGSIALHVSGGLLTEDYYAANKLMKGFLGSAHIQSGWNDIARAAQVAAFGEDVMPATFADMDQAAMVLLVGAATARDHPVLADRLRAARAERGVQLVLIAAGDGAGAGDDGAAIDADLILSVQPGSEGVLLAGLLLHCHDSGVVDRAAVARSVAVPPGYWDALGPGHDIWSVARATGLTPAAIRGFYDRIAATHRLVTVFVAGDPRATVAILNLHLATGRIGRPGAAPFAMTSAANGMGGREVGCAATMLAAHRDFSDAALSTTARFWGGRAMARAPGRSGDALLRAIADGAVKALWSIGGAPSADPWLGEAMAVAPLAILSTPSLAEAKKADIALPSPAWVEKDGTLTGADRLISRQRHLFPLPGEARPDWWMVTQVARAMGWHDAFFYERAADLYREHARLTAYGNDGARLLDLRRHAAISNPAYDELTPWRWGDVPFDGGRFATDDGRGRVV